jgi:hypothetical protein
VVCAAALNKARAELCAVAAHASTTAAAAAAAAAAASGAARKAQNGFERAHVARRKAWVSALGVRAAARERFRAAAVEYGASGNGGTKCTSSCISFLTVTFYANLAHSLTRSP